MPEPKLGREPVARQLHFSDFLTCAMLNVPGVEAAYYDCAAWVERITQARSFPDPQLTFQMDIQNVVTALMPGLMGNIPWPDKPGDEGPGAGATPAAALRVHLSGPDIGQTVRNRSGSESASQGHGRRDPGCRGLDLLARKARLPDFSLGLMADARTSPTLYRLPGSPRAVSLPIWRDKIAAQIAEAQANKRSAEARLSGEQIALAVDFAQRSYLCREATRNLALLDEQLLPKARRSLDVAHPGNLAGQIDFFNLTDSERTLLGFELAKVETAVQREVVPAELSLIIQGMSPASAPMASGAGGINGGTGASPGKAGPAGMR